MGTRHDGALLGRCADEPVAFEELVARYQASLIRYANRRLGPAHADDIVNETFAVAYARRATFDHTRTDARSRPAGGARDRRARCRRPGRRGVTPDEAALAPRDATRAATP